MAITVCDGLSSAAEDEVCVHASGAACTAITLGSGAAERAGDLVFRVRLGLDMERRTGGAGRTEQRRHGAHDGACRSLVKGGAGDLPDGDR
jgi:hypothetical protein